MYIQYHVIHIAKAIDTVKWPQKGTSLSGRISLLQLLEALSDVK